MKLKRSLRTHLLLLYVMLAVLSGIIVPLAGVRRTLSEFRGYLQERKKYDVDELAESLLSLYQEEGAWNGTRIADVLRQASKVPMAELYDAEGRKVFPSKGVKLGAEHDLRSIEVRGTAGLPGAPENRELRSGVNRIDLYSGGAVAGTMLLTLPSLSGKMEMMFARRLGQITVTGAVLMIVLACALGFFVAGGLSRPILKAAGQARLISGGDYGTVPAGPTGIRELDALSESVADLGRSLAGQERLRKRLMTDIAHELRTPLTVVKSQVEAFVDGVWEATPERLNACVTEIDRLSDLIEEVEQLSRLEGEVLTLQTEPVDLGVFLEKMLSSFKPLFARSDIELTWTLEEGVVVRIDAGRFRHVIENLMSNARRYTESGGRVEVRLGASEGRAGIVVEDSGAGIRPVDLPHVFERFYRADESRSRGTGGRGVGLAIAKAAAEAHGGTIAVESAPGRGTRFTVTLPLYRGAGARGPCWVLGRRPGPLALLPAMIEWSEIFCHGR
jgi:signal transduction histidine kinase